MTGGAVYKKKFSLDSMILSWKMNEFKGWVRALESTRKVNDGCGWIRRRIIVNRSPEHSCNSYDS